MEGRPPSLVGRAFLALGLMIGFYVFAVAIALGLLYLPYAEVAYTNRIHPKLAIFCIVGAAVILWSIIPRPDRFTAPGPLLTAASQPRLFQAIQEVASATGQSMPEDVYLVPDLNAWVAQRGGIMGFGSHRVMGLGLPLLQVLSVTELRAVLAHEFGHYHGGDTKLGPWVYKTRAAIGRTLEGLAQHSSTLQQPFIWYGNLFLRVSHGVSRRQELTADELAADTVGARPLIDGLTRLHAADGLLGSYWSSEVVPVLEAGFLPPVADGFRQFIAGPAAAAYASRLIEEALSASDENPYETHPPLRERVQALASFPDEPPAVDQPPAIGLLADVPQLERDLMRPVAATGISPLRPIRWEDVGIKVYAPFWADTRKRYEHHLPATPIQDLVEGAPTMAQRLIPVARAEGEDIAPEKELAVAARCLGEILADALVRAGWRIEARLGERIALQGPSGSLDPFRAVQLTLIGDLSSADWRRQCADLGLAGVTLGQGSAEPATPRAEGDAAMSRLVAHAMSRPAAPVVVRPQPPVAVQCWSCKTTLPVPVEARGKRVRCPQCGTKQRLPA